MAIKRRKNDETHPDSMTGMYEAIDGFVCDLENGTPVAVKQGEIFEEDHELVRRFKGWYFIPHPTPTWRRNEILQKRLAQRSH